MARLAPARLPVPPIAATMAPMNVSQDQPVATGGQDGQKVRRRIVFYIPGYDPRGPGHYHRLYTSEAAKQAAINDLQVDVGPRHNADACESQWKLTTGAGIADYRFLRYDDIMRARWPKTTPAILRDILHYTGAFLRRGVFARVLRLSWPMFVTISYAPALLAAALLVALAVAAASALIVPWYGATLIGAIVLAACLALRPIIEPRVNAFWLARILNFIADQGNGTADGIEARTDDFARRIAAGLNANDADEVLVVGHSVGTQIAVSACARALATAPPAAKLSLLTLGHTIPLIGLQPPATAFRAELAALAADPRCDWIDVSAAIDSACFPLTDPVVGSGLTQPTPESPKPKLVSARFPKLFTPATYAMIRRDFSRAHFQYLMAAELPGDYDYFLITAGTLRLADRFAHLASVADFNRFRLSRA